MRDVHTFFDRGPLCSDLNGELYQELYDKVLSSPGFQPRGPRSRRANGRGPDPPGVVKCPSRFPSKSVLDALLHGRAGRLIAKNGGFWPGQNEFEFYGVGEALVTMRERDMDGDGVRTHG
jgi:hypothetical protein